MTKKIFHSIIVVALTVLAASLLIASTFLYDYFNKSQSDRLKEELNFVAEKVEAEGIAYLENFYSSVFRFTLVSPNGSVLYDSKVQPQGMENHLDREEITEALKNGRGSSARYSATLTERNLYEAVKLKNGNVLRASVSQVTAGALIFGMLPAVSAIIIISVFVALVLSNRMAKSIVKPLSNLDLENPIQNEVYEELTPILSKINKQYKLIAKQMRELRRKSNEFEQITSHMNEGLILLDKEGQILSINTAAKKLFGADNSAMGKKFSAVEQSEIMNTAIENALNGMHSEFHEERKGREYQFFIDCTEFDMKTAGVVILCLDITEKINAERNRMEFTANVSHELKTPLQSIIGSAELLENGLVKPEDTEKFICNIKKDATRLIHLINDIIRLSQLDEERGILDETVDIFEVAQEVSEVLIDSACRKNIKFTLKGEPCIIKGVRRYLFEIIYNLCDNAIRYNKENGSITLELKNEENHVILSVSDTGIGIPEEDQSRVFERFFRVDKSHSKETGGTGLGLSIVKHAVLYHKGEITVESIINSGTNFTVKLPK